MRKRISTGCAFLLALSLTACAGSSDIKNTTSDTEPASSAFEPESAVKETESEKTTETENEPKLPTEDETTVDQTEDQPETQGKDQRLELDLDTKASVVEQILTAIGIGVYVSDKSNFVTSFDQKYSLGYEADSETEKEEVRMDYEASAEAIMSFVPIKDKDNVGFYDYLENGDGFLQTGQTEKCNFYAKDTDKLHGDRSGDLHQNYEISKSVTLKTEGDDIYALSNSVYFDYMDKENSYIDQFNGRIAKKAFLDNVSTDFLNEFSQKLLFSDTWEYLEEVSCVALEFLGDIDLENEEEVDRFIKENDIEVKSDENSIYIEFDLKTAGYFKETEGVDSDLSDTPTISGTVIFSSVTGELLSYKYDLADFLEYVLRQSLGQVNINACSVDRFDVYGASLDYSPRSIDLINEFVDYKGDQAEDYIADRQEHVLGDR